MYSSSAHLAVCSNRDGMLHLQEHTIVREAHFQTIEHCCDNGIPHLAFDAQFALSCRQNAQLEASKRKLEQDQVKMQCAPRMWQLEICSKCSIVSTPHGTRIEQVQMPLTTNLQSHRQSDLLQANLVHSL